MTPRTREVLLHTARGLRVREVAELLWITESTVKQHLAEVRWRFQVRTTARAVVVALILGELSLSELD